VVEILERSITGVIPVEKESEKVSIPKGRRIAQNQRLTALALFCSDILLAFLVWEVAFVLQSFWGHGLLSQVAVASVVPSIAAWVGLRALLGLYPGYGLDPVEELRRQTYAVFVTLAITAIFGTALHVGGLLSRLLLLVSFLGLLILAPVVRYLVKYGMLRIRLWGKPVLVLGSGEPGAHVVQLLKEEWQLGYRPVAVFDNSVAPSGGFLEDVPYGGTLTDAMFSGWEQRVDTVIFAMPYTRRERLEKYVHLASSKFRRVMLIPNLSGLTNSAVIARDLAGTFGVEVRYNLLDPWALRTKRVLDLAATIIGGILILPLILLICLFVWLESGSPIFYRDWRTGRDGKLFSCLKFRTMVSGAEEMLQRLLQENSELREEYLEYHKLRDDPRVTRIGRFLRKTSLDELPQLWNVLRGEMSLVGPRPYLPRESEDVGATQNEILRVPPGITGPWQVSGRNAVSFDERVGMDAHYVHDWSVWLDLVLLARTVKCLLVGKGAC